mmetsp:Transcript_69049/g.174018  ORF Transcript_69049/g.174018 Transcript_69049/m.174018 type:complete len:457 (+) Transcript_69049:95-1465(+)
MSALIHATWEAATTLSSTSHFALLVATLAASCIAWQLWQRGSQARGRFGGCIIPDSPKCRSRSTIMQAPVRTSATPTAAAATVGRAFKQQVQQQRIGAEKKLKDEGALPQIPAAAASDGARPAGPTLLRYRGPSQPPRSTAAASNGGGLAPTEVPPPPAAGGFLGGEATAADEESGMAVPVPVFPAYPHGSPVEFFSAAERRWLPATVAVLVKEGGAAGGPEAQPAIGYEVVINRTRQLRKNVSLDMLRTPLKVGEAVEVRPQAAAAGADEDWLPAMVEDRSGPSLYRVRAQRVRRTRCQGADAATAACAVGEEQSLYVMEEEENLEEVVFERIRAEQLCRRYDSGTPVEVYRGCLSGWAPALVEGSAHAASNSGSAGDCLCVRLEQPHGGSLAGGASGAGVGRAALWDAEKHIAPARRQLQSWQPRSTGQLEVVPLHLVRPRPVAAAMPRLLGGC